LPDLFVRTCHLTRFFGYIDSVLSYETVDLPADSVDCRNIALLKGDSAKKAPDRPDEGLGAVGRLEPEVVEGLRKMSIHGFDLTDWSDIPVGDLARVKRGFVELVAKNQYGLRKVVEGYFLAEGIWVIS
jgi:hypothetical protein